MTTAATRSPRADAVRNRRRVLDAAAHVFAEHGSDATLNQIARAAGVGVGTVYRKFADKDALLEALVDEKIDALVEIARDASTIDDPGAAIRRLLLEVMGARACDRGLDAVLSAPDRSSRFADELGRRFMPIVERLVTEAVEAHELRADFSAEEVCVLGFMVGKVADVTRRTDPDLWRRYAQLLIDGTRPRPGAPPLSPGPLTFAENAAALGRAG